MSETYIPVEGGKVYSRAFGSGSKTPILVLHGGPGFSHNLLLPVQTLARELGQVRRALGLDRLILRGASRGTMLAVDYLLTEPVGVEALILSSPCLNPGKRPGGAFSRLGLRAFAAVVRSLIQSSKVCSPENSAWK